MYEWQRQIQTMVDEIDKSLCAHDGDALTLRALAGRLQYSEYHATRKFREVSGMPLREYLRRRRLAFALKDVRDSGKPLLEIAVDYGFTTHEAFTRAFKSVYGVTPGSYRKAPGPLILRTKLTAFDRYLFGMDELGMVRSPGEVKAYFVTIPAHKFLCVENYESNGYWDFWEKQGRIPGQDRDTVCGLLDSIPGKLDDQGGSGADSGGGQLMAYISNPAGRLCDWGFPRTECYGVRLPASYSGAVPPQLLLKDIPEGQYIVFEHGPFDYEQENRSVEEAMETAMAAFDYGQTGYRFDPAPGRILYLYYQPERTLKYVRPVRRLP